MIYKTLKKVSEYCQLLDKSNFPATKTENGVTWTNNGDGTIAVDGTATGGSTYKLSSKILIKSNRKYLYCGIDNSKNVRLVYNLFYSDGSFYTSNYTDSSIIIDTAGIEIGGIQVFAKRNDNIPTSGIVKPQLFDLTEMYGAGNEPTTVEEFRTKFPNELYDYKPYCFVKSYKNCLTCTTKNLFDISKVPIISGRLTVKDNSICSYDYPVTIEDTNLLSIFKALKPNTNYTMSATTLNYLGDATNNIVLIFSNVNDYKNIFYNYSAGFNKVTFSLTQEQINNITYVYFYGRNENSGGPTIWRNIQLEEGSTASEYQPYGYIQSRKKSLKVSNSILL